MCKLTKSLKNISAAHNADDFSVIDDRNAFDPVLIAARFRWLGRLLPGDEVMAGKRLASGSDDVVPFIATRTETKQSRLFVDLKLYILPCTITVAAHTKSASTRP